MTEGFNPTPVTASQKLKDAMARWNANIEGVDADVDALSAVAALLAAERVSVKEHGAVGDGTTDDTAAIQAAIDACAAAGGGIVVLPPDTYVADGLLLKTGVRVVGAGRRSTVVKARAGSSSESVFAIGTGPVVDSGVSGVKILANGNAGQHGLYFRSQAQATSPFHGGLWWSVFDDLEISGFGGFGVYLRGGPTDKLLPNQFLTFRRVDVYRASGSTSRCLKVTGQVGQVLFETCQMDGPTGGIGTGTNIEITREFQVDGVTAAGDNAPYNLHFDLLTTQNAQKGVFVDRANTVLFSNPYFENLHYAVDITTSSYGVSLNSPRFANASSDGASGGYAVRTGAGSYAAVRNPYILGATDTPFRNLAAGANVRVDGAFMGANSTPLQTSGQTIQVNNAATLTIGSARTVLVNSGATNVTTLVGHMGPGESVHLKAFGGSFPLATGGNIDLGGRASPLTVPQNVVATLTRFDGGGTWILTGLSA